MASMDNLIKQQENMADSHMAEMSAVMKERDLQADERMKLMSDIMQRRDINANVRMVDLMTTTQVLTLGVRAIVSQTASTQTQVAPSGTSAFHQTNVPFTSAAAPLANPTYRKVTQPSGEQIKRPKLMSPATPQRTRETQRRRAKWLK